MNTWHRGGRRRLFIFVIAAAVVVGGCRQRQEGAVTVSVIGGTPRIVDPAAGSLDPAEAVMLQNVAQGLVRFDAQGQIEPGLAERWNVSNDGLSYIFRLASGEWPSGRKITAHDVARILRRQVARQSRNALKDTVGAIDEIVAMTDRVLEIRLRNPRPHLLQLLAQPEFALVRNGEGTGPFTVQPTPAAGVPLVIKHGDAEAGEAEVEERVELRGGATDAAVRSFLAGESEVVLGGTFADLGVALGKELPRGALRFDPVAGLFGLVPSRKGGPLADPEVRDLLDRAIDRDALVAALGVPDLTPRTSILQPGLETIAAPATPEWAGTPLAERRPQLVAEAQRLFADREEPLVIRIALPEGPGAAILLERLRADWGALGVRVEPAERGVPTDLRLIDLVAPSVSPAWFLRQFRCETAAICDPEADTLLEAARQAAIAPQRAALLSEAERRLREAVVFMPIAAPVRWSLVARGISGFAENRFARHTLTSLRGAVAAPRRE